MKLHTQAISRRPLGLVALALLTLLTATTLFIGRANAVPSPATFELDGNTHTGTTDDWEDVFNGTDSADKAIFIPDFDFPAGTQPDGDDQPETGATKDPNDMDQWDCKAAGLAPPKNDMANAFVASYTVGGSQFIYFGLDRINSDNGTANVGFWFTKDNHSCDLATGEWNDQKHSEGDTLVVSEFTGGGRVSTIKVFVWCSDPAAPDLRCGSSTTLPPAPPAGTGDGPLQLIFTGADCLDDNGNPINTPSANLACATVNRGINTDGPDWPYKGAAQGGTNKPCQPGDLVVPGNNNGGCKTYERGALFEGGINATGLGLNLQCLGTFIADTRSAASTTAQLHDFALGQVDLCEAGVTTLSSPNSNTVVPGTAVSDTATVAITSGNGPTPTGTVKFFLCQPSEVTAGGCEGTAGTQIGTPSEGETLDGSGVAQSESTTNTTAIGKYCWRAEYSGDVNYPSPDDDHIHTNTTTECFTTVPQNTTTTTTSSPTGGNVNPGTSVTDTAVVSPSVLLGVPTGTVDFFLCQPNEVTAGGCEGTAGTKVGATKTLSPVGGANALQQATATSDATTNTTAIGTYCWRAVYTPDASSPQYNGSSHTNSTTECFTTVSVPTTTSTTSNPTGGNVVPGTSVTDTAVVTPSQLLGVPTGTVDFFLCQPATVTANGGDCSAGGTKVGATKNLTPVGGTNAAQEATATSDATTNTTAIGKYCWRAEFTSTSSQYNSSSHTNSTTECFTTVPQPTTVSTTSNPSQLKKLPGTSVSDSATVTPSVDLGTPTGTVDFFLCQPNEVTAGGCEGTAGTKIGASKALVGGSATSDATTDTNTVGTYCWRAVYTPDAGSPQYLGSSHTNATTECFEIFLPSTLISFSDQIVGLPTDATGEAFYEVYGSQADCLAETNLIADITPANNDVNSPADGKAPQSDLYTPASPGGEFWIRAVFVGSGDFAGVTFVSCEEHVNVVDTVILT